MECEVAREALSARLDGERQHVPAARVDAHVESCPDCRKWLANADELARRLRLAAAGAGPDLSGRIAAAAGPEAQRFRGHRWSLSHLVRAALLAVGVVQLAVAIAQIGGVNFGVVAVGGHGAMTGAQLVNESIAWSLGLGCGMVAAAIWPGTAPGVATVLGVFTVALVGYLLSDAWAGQLTAARVASLPAVVGLLLLLLLLGERIAGRRRAGAGTVRDQDIALPAGASRGRRRGHLRPTDHSAA